MKLDKQQMDSLRALANRTACPKDMNSLLDIIESQQQEIEQQGEAITKQGMRMATLMDNVENLSLEMEQKDKAIDLALTGLVAIRSGLGASEIAKDSLIAIGKVLGGNRDEQTRA